MNTLYVDINIKFYSPKLYLCHVNDSVFQKVKCLSFKMFLEVADALKLLESTMNNGEIATIILVYP